MSKTSMRAVGVSLQKREVRMVDQPLPQITGPYDVKIKTLEVGVCGTDKEICSFVYGFPPEGSDYLVLGHECLAQVVEVGDGVSMLKPGNLVVPSVRRPCAHHHCRPCQVELQDFCVTGDYTERGIKKSHGFMTEYSVEEEKFLNYVPAELRDIAVLVEPLTIVEKALAQIRQIQQRMPWSSEMKPGQPIGEGLRAVVLGAGPVGILGAMALRVQGFDTYVYSRSPAPNPKAELVEALGAHYLSSKNVSVEQLAERVGNINVVYEAVGATRISFDVLKVLGINGIFVFTGLPAPNPPIDLQADILMRNIVLKNQVVVGTVNADRESFQGAIRDLGTSLFRWPAAVKSLITGRHKIESFQELLLGEGRGIKNVVALD